MQFTGLGKPPAGVVFDSNMGDGMDAALALALLYGFDGRNEVRVASLSTTRSNLQSAAFCDAIARFYAGAVSGAFGVMGRSLPVGMATDGKLPADTPLLTQALASKAAGGQPLYPHGIHKLNETADPAALIRNAFTAQHNQNSIGILCGPATNFVAAMLLPGVKDLISRKVKLLSVDATFLASDMPAARALFAQWPGPIVAAGPEIGRAIPYPGSSIESDFTWAPAHPIAGAYRLAQPMPYDAPASGLAAVLYAVRPQEGYFQLSEPGTLAILDDGTLKLTPSAGGAHRQLVFDPAQKERVQKLYTEMVSAKPVERKSPKKAVEKEEPPAKKPNEK